MNRRVSSQALGRALADLLGPLPRRAQPVAVRACARFLQRQRRLHEAPAILRALDASLLARDGKRRAALVSAETLHASAVRAIERQLTVLVGASVQARTSVHQGLLAGFRADVGDTTVDASLRGLLHRLRGCLRTAAGARDEKLLP